ncbi:mCG128136, partial [Mus musculus]
RDRVSHPGCPGTHSVDQAGLELRNPPASASRVLGLKAYVREFLCDHQDSIQRPSLKKQNKLKKNVAQQEKGLAD